MLPRALLLLIHYILYGLGLTGVHYALALVTSDSYQLTSLTACQSQTTTPRHGAPAVLQRVYEDIRRIQKASMPNRGQTRPWLFIERPCWGFVEECHSVWPPVQELQASPTTGYAPLFLGSLTNVRAA